MNWEVRTMQSKTSLFNKRLFLNSIKSILPSMVGLLLLYFGMEFVPGVMRIASASRESSANPVTTNQAVDDVMLRLTDDLVNPILIGVIAILLAIVLFWYQYSRRSSYMLHALPVKRSTHFVSHVLAGIVGFMILVIVCYGSLACLSGFSGHAGLCLKLICICFVETTVEFLFFFSLALFVTMVCGNAGGGREAAATDRTRIRSCTPTGRASGLWCLRIWIRCFRCTSSRSVTIRWS